MEVSLCIAVCWLLVLTAPFLPLCWVYLPRAMSSNTTWSSRNLFSTWLNIWYSTGIPIKRIRLLLYQHKTKQGITKGTKVSQACSIQTVKNCGSSIAGMTYMVVFWDTLPPCDLEQLWKAPWYYPSGFTMTQAMIGFPFVDITYQIGCWLCFWWRQCYQWTQIPMRIHCLRYQLSIHCQQTTNDKV